MQLNYLPQLPAKRDFTIGCIGTGFIMAECHLVAYQQAGFNPVAITGRDVAKAQQLAQQRNIPTVHVTIDGLLQDSSIEVLDIAVPPAAQPEIIRQAIYYGKGRLRGILAQKPLAMDSNTAQELVDACTTAGVHLAVNQNMRFDQSIRAMKDVLNRQWLGEPVLATIEMRAIPHWMPWSEELHSLSTFIMSIHHLDAFRYWFGTPDRVLASTRTDPRTRFPHRDGINLYILEYENGLRCSSWDDVWAGPAKEGLTGDIGIRWRVEGTDGIARGTIGWPSYPERTPSTIDFASAHLPAGWHSPRWPEVWFPDAFVGTMAQLLVAIETNQEPEISGKDNIQTIQLCEAVFAAATEHRVITLTDK